MKLSDIKTTDQFFAFVDIWYQRTKKLAAIMMDESVGKEKQYKASKLWWIMRNRMQPIIEKSIEIRTPKLPKGFVTCNRIINEKGEEVILKEMIPMSPDFHNRFKSSFNGTKEEEIKAWIKSMKNLKVLKFKKQ